MSWILYALIATLGWGFADLFYKKGTDENDKHSHLKTAVWVGMIMGGVSLFVLVFFTDIKTFPEFLNSAVRYSPASFGYIISMVIGYAGLRYLEISIISPVQNASGAFSALAVILYYLATGRLNMISRKLSYLEIIGTGITVIGVISLAFLENKLSKIAGADKKYRYGAPALIFPLLYCLFDTLGTAADGIILSDEKFFGMGELEVLAIYGLTFFAVAIVLYIYMYVKERKPYNPFEKKEIKTKGTAALFEESGQIFYVYAMAANPVLAAPVIASYCAVSVVLSRIVLKEKLEKPMYISICLVILGIILLGISEGISEL